MISSSVTDRLRHADLVAIANGKLTALVVRSFIEEQLAREVGRKLLSGGYQHYINAPSIGRIGMAFYETERRASLIKKYFDSAMDHIDKLRLSCLPYASPIDILRCRLDEVWPAGASLERLYGRTMFVGLSRVVEPDVCFMAHHDFFQKDAPDSFRALSLVSQLACNIYLNMPHVGGELHIWDEDIAPDVFDDMRGENYGIEPQRLGDANLLIKPDVGDLVIFDSRKMHSVAPSKDTSRVSLSCFIGYRGEHAPLSYWS